MMLSMPNQTKDMDTHYMLEGNIEGGLIHYLYIRPIMVP